MCSVLHQKRGKEIKDPIHGFISVSPLAVSILDTSEFKQLMNRRQLAQVRFVYPSANHTRAEHSLGVYHLAGIYIDQLAKSTTVTPRTKELIQIAGLVHDIGHLAFSHWFDNEIAKKMGLPHHEVRGVKIFREMVIKYKLDLLTEEVDFICALVLGQHRAPWPRWMFQIIANSFFELDVDKLDYLLRDSYYTGMPHPLQVNRIFRHCRVNETTGDITFHKKVYQQIHDVFMTRYRMHKDVYRHHTVIAMDWMLKCYMSVLMEIPEFKKQVERGNWHVFGDDMLNFASILLSLRDDWSPDTIEKLSTCQRVKLDMDERKIPKFLGEVTSLAEISEFDAKTHLVVPISLGFSSKNKNPMDDIYFYDHDGCGTIRHLESKEISKLISVVDHEDLWYVYKIAK